jgi:hypothetical protein
METGKRYMVTKPSNDGTFSLGDHIYLENDGSISCLEARAWIVVEDVAEATEGMEIEVEGRLNIRKQRRDKGTIASDKRTIIQPGLNRPSRKETR